ncbi:MAG TPA: carbamoyltransferase HypF, partial [Thiotrichales bacterium]|nr:carbamoyltransferase HypF [Thiotrichales bacterium]
TTMASFSLCTDCLAEYNDPANRRFHAEPVACPACGPVLRYRDGDREICDNEVALTRAVERLHNGGIVAVKGIGGYHLVCDAGSEAAVERLRRKKQRPHKPLAVMFPAPVQAPLANVEQNVLLSEEDRRFLLQAARPILLLQKRPASQLCDAIAPGLNEVGVMLPYSPLHHLLLNAFGGALVATSANISGEPVLIDNDEVETRLAQVADAFLHHNRSIQRPADDPVYRRIAQHPRPLRLGRGAAPLELALPFELAQPVLAVGAHMKNTITLAWGNRAVVSPHIGEMDSARTMAVFENIINDLEELYKVEYREIICDAHPSYRSTRWAQQQARRQHIPLRRVYHHHAHAAAASVECWSDIEHDEALLAFTWDGVGYGEDGSLWGGEALLGRPGQWRRVATMQPFYLPGGERAGREPWRSAAALCWETGIAYSAMPADNGLLQQAWQRKINAPKTTSVGRLFDAAAALSGVLQQASFEGQAPMVFEALAGYTENFVEMELKNDNNLLITNWSPLVSVMQDTAISQAERASLFHASMARALLQQARVIRSGHEVDTVCLCGGVFQNRLLTQQVIALLEADGFRVRLPELIPVNDAGISFGQIIEYAGLAARRDSQP